MVGASGARPINGRPPDAPTIETIVLVTFYEIIFFDPLSHLKWILTVKPEEPENS